jgi:hypothetical protein
MVDMLREVDDRETPKAVDLSCVPVKAETVPAKVIQNRFIS